MVDEELFGTYSTALQTNSELADQAILALESKVSGLEGEELIAALSTVYTEIVNKFGASAAYVALEFYTSSREAAEVDSAYSAQVYYPDNQKLLYWDVRDIGERSTSLSSFVSSLGGRAQQRVNEYVDETLIGNSRRDPAHPKWALVPGFKACSWCCMLGGLGFQYNERDNIPRHPSCKCATIVDFDINNPKLNGYNPAALAERYNECQKTALGGKSAWDAWNELSDEEREEWKIKAAKAKITDYDLWRRSITLQEMRTRDREWLRTGTPPSFDTAASWTKEGLLVANLLNKNGFSIQRVEPSKEFRERRCDCLLNGEKWEIKAPRGNGYLTIYNQFKKVVYGSSNVPNPQSDKLIISNVVSDMPMLKMAKGVQRTFEENAFLEISEVLLCDKGGELWRLKR